jgi:hypothetical protein
MKADGSGSFTALRLPKMSLSALIALIVSLCATYEQALAGQVSASKNRAANTPGRKRKDDETAAIPVAIPSGVMGAMRKLTDTGARLESEARVTRDPAANRELRRAALRYVKRWGALRSFVDAFSALEADGDFDPETLRAAMVRVFGEKRELAFLRGKDRDRWTAGRQKLALVEREGLAELVTGLGGGRILAQLRREHDAYGAASGVTVARGIDATRDARPVMREARAAVGDYALKVSAMADDATPGSAELVATLLAPIESARQGAPKRAKTKAKAAVPEASPEKVSVQRLPNGDAEKTPAVPLLSTGTDGP